MASDPEQEFFSDGISEEIINMLAQYCEIRNIMVREPTLDEVFLRLTGTALRD